MSDPQSHRASHGSAAGHHTGSDEMNLGKIVVVGLLSLTLFAIGIFWAYRIMIGREADVHANGVAKAPTEIGKLEIGIVDQIPFSIDHRLDIWRAETAKHLSSYGWVDRAKGIARIPIEKAMDQVIASPPDIPGEGVPPTLRKMPAAAGPTGTSPSGGKP